MDEHGHAPTAPVRVESGRDTAHDLAPLDNRRIALVDLLDRVLAGGVVAMGDIELSIADVPLVRISLRAVIASVSTLAEEAARELTDQPESANRPGRVTR
jgi:hypothetical protein